MTFPLDIEDVCECEPLPVLRWRRAAGEWITAGDISGDPEAAGDAYLAGTYTAWVVCCPECYRIYGAGEKGPETSTRSPDLDQ